MAQLIFCLCFLNQASGTTTIAAIMQTLGFAYQAVDTSSLATYTITSSGSGQANALAGSSDYTSTNSIPTKSAMGGLQFPSSAYRIKSLIHTGDALIPMYNIPVCLSLLELCVPGDSPHRL
jgi:hypothetical protein